MMKSGAIESIRYLRNPLDVLAQQIVAIVSERPRTVDEVAGLVRRSAAFSSLPESALHAVLDMLGGYGSCGRPLCCTTFLQSFEPISINLGVTEPTREIAQEMVQLRGPWAVSLQRGARLSPFQRTTTWPRPRSRPGPRGHR